MTNEWVPMEERGPHVTEEAIRRFEEKIDAQLPADYRAFLLDVNGGRTARSHCTFRLRKYGSVLNSLYSLDASDENDDLAACQMYRDDVPPNALWVGSDDGGSGIILVLSGPHRGEVWYLDRVDPRPEDANPRVEWFDRRDVRKLAASFCEFMHGLRPLDTALDER
jgi:hypothetical protein